MNGSFAMARKRIAIPAGILSKRQQVHRPQPGNALPNGDRSKLDVTTNLQTFAPDCDRAGTVGSWR